MFNFGRNLSVNYGDQVVGVNCDSLLDGLLDVVATKFELNFVKRKRFRQKFWRKSKKTPKNAEEVLFI